MKRLLAVAVLLPTVSPAQQPPGAPPPGSRYAGEAFRFTRIQEDIYHAVGSGRMAVGANAAIIINENDVLVVDSHISPAAAWALLKELKAVTPKPVRYVVNTHFHFDHTHGNQIFPPDVEVIGHEFTREMIAAGKSKSGRGYDRFIGGLPNQIAALRRRIDTTSVSRVKDSLQAQLSVLENQVEATGAVVPTPPSTTLSHRMTLYRGGREIRLL
ncbi:MAG: MBL fold metallo-hydrolase, partial [Gemmatimonadetes bacterium]|nr:MBL fold metallo-hydrolase [Gemmatimonadota bacterium]